MTPEHAVLLVRKHIEDQFPKSCSQCGRVFHSLAEYLQGTQHVDQPISYDAALGNWLPHEPLGTVSLANCTCGTTLSVGSEGMPLLTIWRLMLWARGEAKRRDIGMRQLLSWMRDEIDRQALAEAEA